MKFKVVASFTSTFYAHLKAKEHKWLQVSFLQIKQVTRTFFFFFLSNNISETRFCRVADYCRTSLSGPYDVHKACCSCLATVISFKAVCLHHACGRQKVPALFTRWHANFVLSWYNVAAVVTKIITMIEWHIFIGLNRVCVGPLVVNDFF